MQQTFILRYPLTFDSLLSIGNTYMQKEWVWVTDWPDLTVWLGEWVSKWAASVCLLRFNTTWIAFWFDLVKRGGAVALLGMGIEKNLQLELSNFRGQNPELRFCSSPHPS